MSVRSGLTPRNRSRLFRWIGVTLLLCGASWAATVAAQPLVERYLPGQNYRRIADPITPAGDRIPVIEFFLYSCPHCYAFESALNKWVKGLPDDVVFQRVPVLFGAGGRFYARLFYTEKALGVLNSMHAKVFEAIQQQGLQLDNFQVAKAFFEANGISGTRFQQVFNSPAIDEKIVRAARLARAFDVRAVPSLGVAGRYWISGRMAGSNKAMFKVADYLIRRSRTRRSTSN